MSVNTVRKSGLGPNGQLLTMDVAPDVVCVMARWDRNGWAIAAMSTNYDDMVRDCAEPRWNRYVVIRLN